MLSHIRGQDRIYGDTRIYLKTENRRGMNRTLEWTDIYIKRGNAPPRNVGAYYGLNCAQPSLSADGRKLIFIKTPQVQ